MEGKFVVCVHYVDDTCVKSLFYSLDACRNLVDTIMADPFFDVPVPVYSISICDSKGVILERCYSCFG